MVKISNVSTWSLFTSQMAKILHKNHQNLSKNEKKILKIDPKIRKMIIICPKIKNHHWTCAWAPKIKRSSKSMQKWEKSSKIVQKWKNHQNMPKNIFFSLNVTWDPMGTFWTQGNTGFLIFKKTSHEEDEERKKEEERRI